MADVQDAIVPYRWTRAEYDAAVAAGVLAGRKVELLEGVVVAVTPQGREHSDAIRELTGLLADVARPRRLSVQLPGGRTEDSAPEPDVAVDAADRHGTGPETDLAIEVVVTQRRQARVKERIYARAAVPEYWIVDVPRRVVEVMTVPGAVGYEHHETRRGADVLEVPEFGIRFTVDELFTGVGRGRS